MLQVALLGLEVTLNLKHKADHALECCLDLVALHELLELDLSIDWLVERMRLLVIDGLELLFRVGGGGCALSLLRALLLVQGNRKGSVACRLTGGRCKLDALGADNTRQYSGQVERE